MFLSKKNAIYFNKPKNIDPKKPKRVLAGIYHIIQAGRMTCPKKNRHIIINPNHS